MSGRYVVFHNYGAPEGWKIVGESDSLVDAVELREADLGNGGGEVLIFERMNTLEIYGRAHYEEQTRLRAVASKAEAK